MSVQLRDALKVTFEGLEDPSIGADIADSVDDIMTEIVDANEVVEFEERQLEELDAAQTGLESLVEALESSVAEGGMTPQTARVHQVALDNLLRNFPESTVAQYRIATESFGGSQDRLTASQEALEGAKDLLNRIWQAFRNTWMRVWNAVKGFVATIGKGGKALQAGAIQLRNAANAAKAHDTVKSTELDATGIAKVLHVGGKFDGNVAGALQKIHSKGLSVADITSNIAKELEAAATHLLNPQPAQGFFASLRTKVTGLFKPVASTTFDSSSLPGGKIIKADEKKGVYLASDEQKFSGEFKITAPSAADVAKIADQVALVGKMVQDYDKAEFKKMTAGADNVIKSGDKAVKAKKAEDKEGSAALRKELNELSGAVDAIRKIGPAYMGYAASAAKSSLSFGYKALKNLSTTKPEADDKAAAAKAAN